MIMQALGAGVTRTPDGRGAQGQSNEPKATAGVGTMAGQFENPIALIIYTSYGSGNI